MMINLIAEIIALVVSIIDLAVLILKLIAKKRK